VRHLRIIGGSLALAALLVIAGALWSQSGNGRYQAVRHESGGLILVDTRSGWIYLGLVSSEAGQARAAERWKWTPVRFP
jgi:hypothetical protein